MSEIKSKQDETENRKEKNRENQQNNKLVL